MRASVAAAALAAASASAAPAYRELDLTGVIPAGASAFPFGVSDTGLVAFSGFVGNQPFSFLYDVRTQSVVRSLAPGDLVNAMSPDGRNLVGFAFGADVPVWLERDGVRTALPLQVPKAVNDAGQVAGSTGGFFLHAVLFTDGQLVQLGTLGGLQSVANAINASGEIAGTSNATPDLTDASLHAFRWRDGVMQDLGTLGGTTGSAGNGIDAEGRVVGSANGHAVLFDRDGGSDLGTLPGCAFGAANAIADGGAIVGVASACGPGPFSRAFLLSHGRMLDLNALAPARDGATYTDANAINAAGVIAGTATAPDGFTERPFVLVPTGDDD